MKAADLRIGNWVQWNGKQWRVNLSDYNQEYEMGQCFFHMESIPLTEEWLLNFGFKKGVKGWFKTNNNSKFNLYMYNNNLYKSVHQLQNLYLTLTGTELEIK